MGQNNLTYGTKAVNLFANELSDDQKKDVDQVKNIGANLIDKLNNFKEKTSNGESKAALTIAMRNVQSACQMSEYAISAEGY